MLLRPRGLLNYVDFIGQACVTTLNWHAYRYCQRNDGKFCKDMTDDAHGLLTRYHVLANPLRKRYAVFELTESYGRVATDNTDINLHHLYDA